MANAVILIWRRAPFSKLNWFISCENDGRWNYEHIRYRVWFPRQPVFFDHTWGFLSNHNLQDHLHKKEEFVIKSLTVSD